MNEQAEKPTSTEAPKTSGTQHNPAEVNNNPAEVNNNIGWATKLARLATKLVRWLPIGWIGNRLAELAGLANEPPNRGTQNIQSDQGNQANNSGIQHQPHYNSGTQHQPHYNSGTQHQSHYASAEHADNSGTQNIQGDHGKQANNSGTQNIHGGYSF